MKQNILYLISILLLFISCNQTEINMKGNWSVYEKGREVGYNYGELYFNDSTVQIFWESVGNIGFKDYNIINDSLFYYDYFVAIITPIDSETVKFIGEDFSSIAKRIHEQVIKYDSTTMSSRIEGTDEVFKILLDGFNRRKCAFIKDNNLPYEYFEQLCGCYEEDTIVTRKN
jgi:hypothetical protein